MDLFGLFGIETLDLPPAPLELARLLRGEVQRMFGWTDLEHLHEWPYLGDWTVDPLREQDQGTRAHRQFYRKFPRVAELCALLATWAGHELLGGRAFLVQAVPTFRVQFPRSRAVGEAHRDLWYGHQPGELVCWLPLVDAYGTSTVWIQSENALADHPFARSTDRVEMSPAPVRFGQLLAFDAVNLLHGNRLNREGLEPELEEDAYGQARIVEWRGRGRTRVSLDFRVLPEVLHDHATARVSVNTGTPMRLGGYWARPVPDLLELLERPAALPA